MTSIWFLVPAHGRVALTEVCLRQLRRTCNALEANGMRASAVVVADDENLENAHALGFATVERPNAPLGRKWNDAYELAGRAGIDYVVPIGSDDWIDADLVLAQLQKDAEVRCSRLSAVVSEDATRLARLDIRYGGRHDFGDGVRVIATSLLEPLGFRPADEDRNRAIDTSVFERIGRMLGRLPQVSFTDLHALQIVDFKSHEQLNSYASCLGDDRLGAEESDDPFGDLAEVYPAEAIDEMRALHPALAVAL